MSHTAKEKSMPMHVGHVALQVEDLERSVRHATMTLGLRESHREDETVFLTSNERHHELQLLGTGRSGMDHLGLEVEDERDLDAVRDRLVAAGARIVNEGAQEPGLGNGLRCEGPGGIVFEIYVGMQRTPLTLDTMLRPLARKFGHVNILSDEKVEVERFCVDVLSFRVSDQLGDVASWLRCDPDHHGIALAQRSTPGTVMHHYAFELESWSAVGQYADHIARQGQQFVWGPGRHGPGFNHFTYLLDPDGAVVEAYSDLIKIYDEANYVPIDWSQEKRALNLWGPKLPAEWGDFGVPVLPAA